jgi:hypothetical protein
MMDLRVIVVSPEEAFDGIAEFWYGDEMMGTTILDEGRLHLRIDARADGRPWLIDTTSRGPWPDHAARPHALGAFLATACPGRRNRRGGGPARTRRRDSRDAVSAHPPPTSTRRRAAPLTEAVASASRSNCIGRQRSFRPRRIHNGWGNTVNPYANGAELVGGYAKQNLVDLGAEAVDHLIARVLRRAHQAAMAVGAPDEARAILDVAQSFADELATALAGFDGVAFVAAVTEEVS